MKRYTAAELDAMIARGEDKTDWARVDAMTEEELERAIAEDPDSDPPIDWSSFELSGNTSKQGVYIRLDPDVLEHFRKDGRGYQTRINAVLRAYVEEMRKRAAAKPAAE
jgi:uncharacterized protein (DUF4415 family)